MRPQGYAPPPMLMLIVTILFSCRFDSSDLNKALLNAGDVDGGICVMEFSRALSSLFLPPVGTTVIIFKELTRPDSKYDGVKIKYRRNVRTF